MDVETTGSAGFGFSYVLGGSDDLPLRAACVLCERFLADEPGHPAAVWRRVEASFNRTGGGPYRTALAAIDLALWDAYARRADVPLGVALGGAPRAVPVYASGGYRPGGDPEETAARARADHARGVRALKLRAAASAADAPLFRAVAAAVGGDVGIMIDANEKCDRAAALRLLRAADEIGALFVEEPLPASDLPGYRALARSARVPLATGEHLRTVAAALPFVAEGLCAVIQPDLQAVGGLTPALQIARLAEAHGVAVAPHFLPGLFVQLAAAAPNVTWLEEFPLLEPLLDGLPALAADGTMAPPPGPGHGLALSAGAREEYRVAGAP